MKKEILELVIKDLETLTFDLKELVVTKEKENLDKPSVKESKKIGLEDVRAVLATLSQYGKTADVKVLITKYGGEKLSDIDEGKYEDLLKDAEEIKID